MAYSTIRSGSKGPDVKTWQDYLISQGYDIGSSVADGIFGNATLNATKQYQKDKGLSVDGIVGNNTWASMNTGNNTANNNAKKIPEIKGADASLSEIVNSSFSGSDELKGLEAEKNQYKDDALEHFSNKDIVDENTKNQMNSKLEDYLSPEYTQANAYIKEQLAQIQSGKTSWSDQLSGAINDYLNRDKFEYDVDNDQLFQQALASAMNSGKTAMQDTIGQASALTGGYGSTYATNVGNQAYNSFIEDAYNNLPEYYQMALEAYQAEGQEMLNRVNILGSADDREYGRMVDAYNLTSDYANNLWDKGYSEWTTTTSNAINYGNFLLNENQTIGNNIKNAYDITANDYQLKYNQEYNDWYTSIENAWKTISHNESVRQFDANLAEQQRQHDEQMSYNYANLALDREKFNYSKGDTNNDGVVDSNDVGKAAEFKLTTSEINACKKILADGGTRDDVLDYLNALGKLPQSNEDDDILDNAIGLNSSSKDTKKTTVKTGTVSTGAKGNNFRTQEGDNFDAFVDGKTYRVENHGKVTDKKLVKELNSLGVSNKSIFVYDGNTYVKYSDGFYKVGATNILWWRTDGYDKIEKALQN